MTARRSLVLSFAQKYSTLLIQLASIVVVSRTLAPQDIGVFVTAAALAGFAQILVDCGVQPYLIQVDKLTLGAQRAAFGAALATSWISAVALISIALSMPAGLLDASLRQPLVVFGLCLVVTPFATVGLAVLQREMRFDKLYWIGVSGAAVSAATAILLAWAGFGAMSLAWAAFAESLFTTVLVLTVHPIVRPSLTGLVPIFDFAWVWSAINGSRQVADSLIRLSLGLVLGYGALGVLARAQTVVTLFDKALIDAVSPVMLPTLSRRQRSGHQLKDLYLRKVTYLSAVAWPFFGVVALCAEPLVLVLLGPQWHAAITPVRILCVAGLFLPFSGLVLPFLVALGITRRYLHAQLAIQASRTLLVLAAAFVSLEAACFALVIDGAMKSVLAQKLLKPHLGYAWVELMRPLGAGVVATIASLAGAVGANFLPRLSVDPLLHLICASLMAISAWLVALYFVRHPLCNEIQEVPTHIIAAVRLIPKPSGGVR